MYSIDWIMNQLHRIVMHNYKKVNFEHHKTYAKKRYHSHALLSNCLKNTWSQVDTWLFFPTSGSTRLPLCRGGFFIKTISWLQHGPLTRYVKLRVARAPRMPGTFSPPPRISDPYMHHVPWCMPGSVTGGFFWNRWRGKRSRHSRRMRIPQF